MAGRPVTNAQLTVWGVFYVGVDLAWGERKPTGVAVTDGTRGDPASVIRDANAVAQREKLDWFEVKALFGWRVLVPRTKEQAGALSEQLTRAQGDFEQARAAQQIQQQIAGMNVIRGIPPQQLNGYKVNFSDGAGIATAPAGAGAGSRNPANLDATAGYGRMLSGRGDSAHGKALARLLPLLTKESHSLAWHRLEFCI